ncbi:unnamed protein product, partial [Scytosiphon promiscuus]
PLAPSSCSGRVVIVTGANTGIGSRTALHLAKAGARVIMACRSLERGEEARQKLEKEMRESPSSVAGTDGCGTGQGTLEVMKCDLGDLESVRRFARDFKAKHGGQLDVLVNNAGVGIIDGPTLTADGLDMIFGVNFVGHFCLTDELMPLLKSTPAARVVCLSSVMHHTGGTDWESSVIGHPNSPLSSTYPDSKLAMVLFAKELRRRFAAAGSSATAFSVNPGAVRSDIWRNVPKLVMPIYDFFMRVFYLTPEQGCYTSVAASALPLEQLTGSDYYQPYWLPFGRCAWPCEVFGPFQGYAPGRPTLPKDEPAASSALWTTCERIIQAAGSARGDAPNAARG